MTTTSTADSAGPPGGLDGRRRAGGVERLQVFLYRYMLVLVLFALVGLFSFLLPETFSTFGNLRTITATQAVLIILALGLTFPLAAGEFDLSFGAVLGFASSFLAVLTVNEGWPLAPAVLVVLVAALFVGAVNSFFVVKLGISSIITTLGTGTVLAGVTLAVSNNQVIPGATGLVVDLIHPGSLGGSVRWRPPLGCCLS